MSDQQQRTTWALDVFRSFMRTWVPPGAHDLIKGQLGGAVRDAIMAIAPKDDGKATVGWAVFKREHDRDYDRERPSGYVHTIASTVFESVEQADNAQAYCSAKNDGGTYVICEIREIP